MSTAADVSAPTTPPPKGSRPAVEAACDLMARDTGHWQVVLSGLTWADYKRLTAAREAAGRRVRITYALGEAEIMTTGTLHERWKRLLAGLVDAYLEESAIPSMPCGGMTIEREDIDRSFEPDECYYLRPTPALLALRQLDFATDPPPDLAIEVEVSRNVLGRLPVYAAVGVPEVWRFDGRAVTVLLLQPDRTYQPAAASRALPGFPPAEVPRYLGLANSVDYGSILRQFRDWVRQHPTP